MLGDRGFLRPGEWNARILVAVDGRPTNELIFGQSHLDRDFVVPMEAVKQIEVVRGPGSALYGTNAVFGVVNVVTKDGADVNGASPPRRRNPANWTSLGRCLEPRSMDGTCWLASPVTPVRAIATLSIMASAMLPMTLDTSRIPMPRALIQPWSKSARAISRS